MLTTFLCESSQSNDNYCIIQKNLKQTSSKPYWVLMLKKPWKAGLGNSGIYIICNLNITQGLSLKKNTAFQSLDFYEVCINSLDFY